MEEKIIKQFKTTVPFPLLIYKTNITYNEVRKASGIAYILLALMQKSKSEEKICDVLRKFGIPSELHYIFGKEIASLLETGIVQSRYNASVFTTAKYFKEVKMSEVELTVKGRKMFQEGAIPTGQEKTKTADIFFNPVTRKFDVESKISYSTLASCFLGENFLEERGVELDLSGLEDYIRANQTKLGLKAEERLVSFTMEEPRKMQTRKEEGLTISIRPSGVEFTFETSDEKAFFDKYYSSAIMTECMRYKNNYKFVDKNKALIDVVTVELSSLQNVTMVHLPVDAQKQAGRPCKIFLGKGRLPVEEKSGVIRLGEKESAIFLDWVDKNAEFALLDSSAMHYYNAVNVQMPCERFNDMFELQLLVENVANEEQYREVVNAIFKLYCEKDFDIESGKAVLFVVEALKDESYFKVFADTKLNGVKSVDEKIGVLLKLHAEFSKNNGWKSYFDEISVGLFTQSVEEVRLDNMIYKNTVLTPLKKAMGLSNVDYVQRFVKTVKEKESPELVYQALETAGFETGEILSVANVVEGYTQKIILGKDISVDNSLAGKFQNVKVNLWKLNDMLGIESVSNYTLKDDYNVDEFFNAYSTLQTAVKGIEKYKQYAPQGYTQIGLFMGIYEPIHEILSIERTSASHPDKITKKYIDEHLSRGRFKDAICDLVVKLQYDLRELLSLDNETSAHDLIEEAKAQRLIDGKQASSLHKLRMCRNGFQHPEREQISFDKATIEEWRDIVFSIKEEK